MLLYTGLTYADDFRGWLKDRRLVQFDTPHYNILYDNGLFDSHQIQVFAAERELAWVRLKKHLISPSGPSRIRVVLYPDFDAKYAANRSKRPFDLEGSTIRAVFGGFREHLDPRADAAAYLALCWGPPGSQLFRDGIAQWLVGDWHEQPLDLAAGRITSEEGHYTLGQLLNTSRENELSPLVRLPLTASWVRLLYQKQGLETLRRLYSIKEIGNQLHELAALLGEGPDGLEKEWADLTAELKAEFSPAVDPPRYVDGSFFFRGMSYSHEGWGRNQGGGYSSWESSRQLARLRNMGVNAISVIPFGFVSDTTDRTISYLSADETDEELIWALRYAHVLGMQVMLKPQLWVGRGIFTGQIHFEDEKLLAEWMKSYRQYILHYARLAEMEGFDLLCIGNELSGLIEHEKNWRKLIAEVRRVFRGPITYAANWGKEFESVQFWDALDYIGLNNYYPLTQLPNPSKADIRSGAEALAAEIEAVALRFQKPLIFTEAGYSSYRPGLGLGWEESHVPAGLEETAMGYDAIFRAFAHRPWFRGMFWWKWPSNERRGYSWDPWLAPTRKPVSDVLEHWYRRLDQASYPDQPTQDLEN